MEERWMREQFGTSYETYSQHVAALVAHLEDPADFEESDVALSPMDIRGGRATRNNPR